MKAIKEGKSITGVVGTIGEISNLLCFELSLPVMIDSTSRRSHNEVTTKRE